MSGKTPRSWFASSPGEDQGVRLRAEPPAPGDPAWHQLVKRRATVVCVLLGVWAVSIQGRLVQLQAFRHETYSAMAQAQQLDTITLPAKRGDVIDRHGELLAYSVDIKRVEADPSFIEDPADAVLQICDALADCTATEREALLEKFGRDSQWVPVRSSADVTPAQVERLVELDLPGLILPTESHRFYPNGRLASHLLGFVGKDNVGLSGIEYRQNDLIRGQDGRARVRRDARRNRITTAVEQPATAGATIELTIDKRLQYETEQAVRAGMLATNALAVSAIVMVPATGEVLSLANYPDFDPNAYAEFSPTTWRNRAVQDIYEPGSTFKIVTASAALEERIIAPQTLIDVSSGYLPIPGRSRPIIDDHPAGKPLTFEDVLVKSSNVGAVKIGRQVGPERISRFTRRLGFGQLLTSDFSGQTPGIVFPPEALTESALASVSMGYQVSVTALQMVTAVSAIANGGELMEPHIERAVIRNGAREAVSPKVIRRAVSPETAATLTSFMEKVVSRGTATAAALDQYQVAGKTGTSKKAIPGGYSDTDRVGSFVGFVPSHRPEYAILVVVDTPRNGQVYGGAVAAPIFKRIAEAALRLYSVPPTIGLEPPIVVPTERAVDGAVDRVQPVLASRTRSAATNRGATTPGLVPDVRGLSLRDAWVALTRAGLNVTVAGGASASGSVTEQSPAAGTPVSEGATSVIVVERRSGPPGEGGR